MKVPMILTSGEAAGIGPDICLQLEDYSNLVIAADIDMLRQRAQLLGKAYQFEEYCPGRPTQAIRVMHTPLKHKVYPGILDERNASYVLEMLRTSCEACLRGEFSALVTAPINKYIIQKIDSNFLGHTEYFQKLCQAKEVVMLLASSKLKVALITTHLALKDIPKAITKEKIQSIVKVLARELNLNFGIEPVRMAIAGLNPHAGEQGVLGREEIDTIIPAIETLKQEQYLLDGPLSADTMFNTGPYDVYIGMYHDQVLGVLKYASFGSAANISLGLPIIRTSVDHGTALSLAATGQASANSLKTAIKFAEQIYKYRSQ